MAGKRLPSFLEPVSAQLRREELGSARTWLESARERRSMLGDRVAPRVGDGAGIEAGFGVSAALEVLGTFEGAGEEMADSGDGGEGAGTRAPESGLSAGAVVDRAVAAAPGSAQGTFSRSSQPAVRALEPDPEVRVRSALGVWRGVGRRASAVLAEHLAEEVALVGRIGAVSVELGDVCASLSYVEGTGRDDHHLGPLCQLLDSVLAERCDRLVRALGEGDALVECLGAAGAEMVAALARESLDEGALVRARAAMVSRLDEKFGLGQRGREAWARERQRLESVALGAFRSLHRGVGWISRIGGLEGLEWLAGSEYAGVPWHPEIGSDEPGGGFLLVARATQALRERARAEARGQRLRAQRGGRAAVAGLEDPGEVAGDALMGLLVPHGAAFYGAGGEGLLLFAHCDSEEWVALDAPALSWASRSLAEAFNADRASVWICLPSLEGMGRVAGMVERGLAPEALDWYAHPGWAQLARGVFASLPGCEGEMLALGLCRALGIEAMEEVLCANWGM